MATLTPANHSTVGLVPGDIIQFRNIYTYKKVVYPDGSWQYWTYSYPKHTAIIAGVTGSKIQLLQQNVGNNPQTHKTVQSGSLDLADLKGGTMWVYTPIR